MLSNMLRCPELVKTHVKKLVKKHVKIANVGGNHLFCKVFEFPGVNFEFTVRNVPAGGQSNNRR